ncbi:MAG: hypothetical protein HGA45_23290 [Chloroflexales bacterium]|nr:hypothetical protein [Chloroflexales bacterium]
MYLQARVYIKTALMQLVASVLLGALLLADAGLHLHPRLGLLLPVYYHLLMVGWATQLIGGVALWMFPPRSRERPRGDERLGWFTYGALNSGLLIRAVAEPLQQIRPSPWAGWGLALSALLQVLAIWSLVLALWPRVKGRPEPGRLRKGAA